MSISPLQPAVPAPVTGDSASLPSPLSHSIATVSSLSHVAFSGYGVFRTVNGGTYEGEILGGLGDGLGTWRNAQGITIYQGEFVEGLPDGFGERIYNNGSCHKGRWKDGKRDGFGTSVNAAKDSYKGEWKDNKFHGYGKLVYANGSSYEGRWKEGKLDGLGTLMGAAGDSYKGEWKDDKFHGHGKLVYADGSSLEGRWKEGKLDGLGTWIGAAGGGYKGEWKDGKFHGHGKSVYADGSSYVGRFMNGKSHGLGTWMDAAGSSYKGEWKDGKFHGLGIWMNAKGDNSKGEWKDGKFHGLGVRVFADGSSYVGRLMNGEFHGLGTWTITDIGSFKGEWKGGRLHGLGIWESLSGRFYKGWFNRGLIVSDSFHLGDPDFIRLCLDQEEEGRPQKYALGAIADFLIKNNYKEVGEALRSANEIFQLPNDQIRERANAILQTLKEPGASQLLVYGSQFHATGLLIASSSDGLSFKIFNAGDGVQLFHKRHPFRENTFRPVWERCMKGELSLEKMESLMVLTEQAIDVQKSYQTISEITEEDPSSTDPVWIEGQKSSNCTLSWMLAFAKSRLSSCEYNQMLSKLYSACLARVTVRLEWADPKEKEEMEGLAKQLKERLRDLEESPGSVTAPSSHK